MSPVHLMRECLSWAIEARRVFADAFTAAGMLPLFAGWGLGLAAVEALALADPRDGQSGEPATHPSQHLKA